MIHVIYFMIGVAIWVVMPIAFAISGVMFMTSRGDPGMLSRARAWLTNAAWGLGIVLSAWLIVATFLQVLGNYPAFTPYFGGSGTPMTVGGTQC